MKNWYYFLIFAKSYIYLHHLNVKEEMRFNIYQHINKLNSLKYHPIINISCITTKCLASETWPNNLLVPSTTNELHHLGNKLTDQDSDWERQSGEMIAWMCEAELERWWETESEWEPPRATETSQSDKSVSDSHYSPESAPHNQTGFHLRDCIPTVL